MLDYLIEQAQGVTRLNHSSSLFTYSLGMLIGLLLLGTAKSLHGLRGLASFGWMALIVSGAALIQHVSQGAAS